MAVVGIDLGTSNSVDQNPYQLLWRINYGTKHCHVVYLFHHRDPSLAVSRRIFWGTARVNRSNCGR